MGGSASQRFWIQCYSLMQKKIKSTLEQIDQNAFESALDIILNAKHIYIVGIRSCAPLASFMSFYFNLMFDNVHLLHMVDS